MALVNLYRPAALARLLIRFEDFTQPSDTSDIPSEQQPFEAQIKRLRTLERAQVAEVGQITDRWLAKKATQGDLDKAQARLQRTRTQIDRQQKRAPQARGSDKPQGDPFSATVIVVPITLETELNTYRSLDTLTISLPFRDVPLESQNIRSCLIEAFMGLVPAESFATRDRWSLPLDKNTILFRGYVDDWETEHDGDNATVRIQARSLECVLVDAKIDPAAPILRVKKSEKISDYVNRILAAVPATSGTAGGDQLKAIFFRAKAEDEPILSQDAMLRVLQTSKSRAAAAGAPGGAAAVIEDSDDGGTNSGHVQGTGEPRMTPAVQETSAWNVIIQACALVGCVPSYDPSATAVIDGQAVEGDFIAIRPPKTIYQNVQQGVKVEGGSPDGFTRLLPDPNKPGAQLQQSEVRFMVWGHNIKKFSTSRKLGRTKVPVVEVVGYNPDAPASERTIIERFPPPNAKRATHIGPRGEGKTEEVVRRLVRGVRNRTLLRDIAEGLYHSIGRQELVVDIETDDLNSYYDPSQPDTAVDGPNAGDILKLRHGTPVRVLVGRQVRDQTMEGSKQLSISPLQEIFERRTDELRRFLLEQHQRFDQTLNAQVRQQVVEEMVKRMVDVVKSARREDWFYVRQIVHHWSAEDDNGYSADIKLINFVEARSSALNLGTDAKKQDKKFRQTRQTPTPSASEVARTRVLRSQGKR